MHNGRDMIAVQNALAPHDALHLAPMDEATWDATLATCNQATLFHTSRWLQLVQDVYGITAERLGLYAGERLCGLVPLMRRRRGPFTLLGSPLDGASTPYLGPLVPDVLLPDTLTLIERLARQDRAVSVRLSFGRPIAPPVAPSGYQISPRFTLMLPLAGRTQDELWRGMKKNCRAHVRQAEQRGVEIAEAHSPEIFEDYRRLEAQVFNRRRRPVPHCRRFYYALWETLRPVGQLNVFVARHAGRVIGVQVNGWYRGKLYGLFGAIDDAYRQYYAGNLLEWHLIAWAAAQGFEFYDMVDGTIQGLAAFKQGFGAMPVETPYLARDRSLPVSYVRRMRMLLRLTAAHLRATPPIAYARQYRASLAQPEAVPTGSKPGADPRYPPAGRP